MKKQYRKTMKTNLTTKRSERRSQERQQHEIENKSEHYEIIARLSRKLAKAVSQNTELRKYTIHHTDCMKNYDIKNQCNCGLEELLKPKKQEPI